MQKNVHIVHARAGVFGYLVMIWMHKLRMTIIICGQEYSGFRAKGNYPLL